MTKAIEKIIKNFVFEDGKLPHLEIETSDTGHKDGNLLYVVTAFITPDYEAFHSEEHAKDIMNKMETALLMLGFSSVHGQRIRKKGILKIEAFGHHK
jgi:hypothetical protein